jgi:hypothetical protein
VGVRLDHSTGLCLELTVDRRFSQLFSLNLAYTALSARDATALLDEFDLTPPWQLTNSGRPRRFTGKVTSTTGQLNRFWQFQARLQF